MSACALLCCKSLCCAPVFARAVGELLWKIGMLICGFGESVFFPAPGRFALKTSEKLRINREHVAVHFRVLDDRSSARRLHLPSVQKLLPTGIFILGNYFEIGNALPYRKNCFQELFGPVIVIKSVMENLAGKFLSFCAGKAWESPTPLRPAPPSNVGQSGIRARACSGLFLGSGNLCLLHSRPEEAVTIRSSELNRYKKLFRYKFRVRNFKKSVKNYRYRQNCCRELFSHQKRKTVPD